MPPGSIRSNSTDCGGTRLLFRTLHRASFETGAQLHAYPAHRRDAEASARAPHALPRRAVPFAVARGPSARQMRNPSYRTAWHRFLFDAAETAGHTVHNNTGLVVGSHPSRRGTLSPVANAVDRKSTRRASSPARRCSRQGTAFLDMALRTQRRDLAAVKDGGGGDYLCRPCSGNGRYMRYGADQLRSGQSPRHR